MQLLNSPELSVFLILFQMVDLALSFAHVSFFFFCISQPHNGFLDFHWHNSDPRFEK